ncbi:MAG: sulfotransferase family 2 domain-containing protein [Enhydrobacter sp.]|nr:sulfotransferase family 2 domain-containing protein [Enhydrobacter sp.]
MARQAFLFIDPGLVVFWSRKAGNTSLADWLYETAIKAKHRRQVVGLRPRRFLTVGQHVVDHRVALDLVEKMGYADFVVARDPYRRAVSAYVNKFVVDRERRYSSFELLEPFAQRMVHDMSRRFPERVSVGDRYRGFSFKEFLEYILTQVQSRGGEEPRLNSHWNTQVPFYYNERFEYRSVIRLERIETEISSLASRLGTKVPFPARRPSLSQKLSGSGEDLSQIKSVDLANAGMPPAADALLSPMSKELIRAAYEIDFRKLGYAA